MNDQDKKEIEQYYHIIEDITPYSPQKCFSVYMAFPGESMNPVIIKEIDEKRAIIYEHLLQHWSPYNAEVYAIHKLPTTTVSINGTTMPVYIAITEFVDGKTLEEYITENGPLDNDTALRITCCLCDALTYVHIYKVIHKDIKPANIMLTMNSDGKPDNLKLIDFGISKSYSQDSEYETEFAGTIGYRAPETIATTTSFATDVYAIGCILNYLLTGFDPTIKRYKGKIDIEYIIDRCLNIDPSGRYKKPSKIKEDLFPLLKPWVIDKIPIVRKIPGLTLRRGLKDGLILGWYIAILTFCGMSYSEEYDISVYLFFIEYGGIWFWGIIPLLLITDPCHFLYSFLLRRIRRNYNTVRIVRAVLLIISILIPGILAFWNY